MAPRTGYGTYPTERSSYTGYPSRNTYAYPLNTAGYYGNREKRSAEPFGFLRRVFRRNRRRNRNHRGYRRQSNNNGSSSLFGEPSHYSPESKYYTYYKPKDSKTLGKSCCSSGGS